VIEGPGERQHPVPADAAVSGLEAHRPAERGGDADGAAGVGAQGGVDNAGGDGRARSTAGTSGAVLGIPRVAHGSEVGVGGGDAVGQLVHVQLAEHHGAGGFETRHHEGIVARN
jgi:hypothetical protein